MPTIATRLARSEFAMGYGVQACRNAVHCRAPFDIEPHIGALRRLVGKGNVVHLLQDDEEMKRPPAELSAGGFSDLRKPVHRQLGVRASHREPKIDLLAEHGLTFRTM